ncbi:MAG: hypothetical protein J0H08_15850, partial [Rhizobiales bacterium]|nr:hypothetical protein [Hyphomicrobiales bacterium]
MTPAGVVPEPAGHARAGGGRRRGLRLALIALGVVGVVVVLIAAVTVAIVLSGATEIGLVRDRVRAALAGRLGPNVAVEVGRAVMRVDPALGLTLDLEGIEARDPTGAVVLSLPETHLAIDPLSLLGLSVVVTRAELEAPAVVLVQDDAGRIRLAGTASAADEVDEVAPEAPPSLPQLADAVARADAAIGTFLADSGVARLALAIRHGDIAVRDAVSGNVRHFRDVDLTARTDSDVGEVVAQLTATGWSGTWTADVARRIAEDSGDHVVSAGFSQLTLADVMPS